MLLPRHGPLSLTRTRLSRYVIRCSRLMYRRDLTVLALESSADDSCAAIVDSDRRIWSNVVIKQHHLNVKHGGIHPLEAQHAHERNVVSHAGHPMSDPCQKTELRIHS